MRPFLRASFAAALALSAPSAASAASAVQQDPADTARRPAARRAQSLDAVRIRARRSAAGYAAVQSNTATRTDLPLRDVPRSVSIVTRQLIADQSMQSLADVTRYVPGVSMASGEGHRDAPVIRGNNTTADFFVDGARDDAQYLRDLYNAERIEVLKGPEALLFGRGGGGGVINRVTRQADWSPVSSLLTEGGSFDHKRAVVDAGQGLNANVAARLTTMYERSGGFRDAASLDRYGVNPTIAVIAGPRTMVRLGYERFDDRRRVDRGIPSYAGIPVQTDLKTFFGNPAVNHASSVVNIANTAVEHRAANGLVLRNRTTWADYDKFYQNTLPGSVNAAGTRVNLSAYNHAIARRNLLNATDATYAFSTGALRHTLLAGLDLSSQRTDQLRLTGYFADTAVSFNAPITAPTIATPVSFRASATDANNTTVARDASIYLQDQIALAARWVFIAGARFERFDIDYHNNRTGQDLSRLDEFLSPRIGLVFKPAVPVSLYGSYGVSHLPSAGDQFTALTVTTATLEPERFMNREIGAKWEIRSELVATAAVYRVDRTNTSAPDPNNAGRVVQTGSQRTSGWELGLNGNATRDWQLALGIGSQRATIVSTTSAAKAGATVALVPHTTASVWNRYQLTSTFGLGLGVIHQTSMYAAVDNSVVLPGFTRVDGALYASLRRNLRAQVNVENAFDRRYFATTQGNNNIMPGAPRTLRLAAIVSR